MDGKDPLLVSSKLNFDHVKFKRCRFLVCKISYTGISIQEKEISKHLSYLEQRINIKTTWIQEELYLDFQVQK